MSPPSLNPNANAQRGNPILADLIDQTALLFSESRDYHRDDAVKRVFGEGLGSLRALKHRLESAGGSYSVGVVGQTNVGKSTLLNALFGCEIAPRRNGPCTAAPFEFQYGDSWGIAVHYEQSLKRPVWSFSDLGQIHVKLAELGSGAEAEAGRGIRKIVVSAPFGLLRRGLIVCDTPGFNAAQTGEAEGQHEEVLKRYMKTEVSQVLWVVSAEQAIGKAEMDFHTRFFAEICDDIVVTNCDNEGEMWDDRDRDRFRKRYAARFGYRLPNFHFVSGAWGFEARQKADADMLAEAGIPELEKRIRFLADPENRMRDIIATWSRLGDDVAAWLASWEHDSGVKGNRWRPDTWARWLQAAMVSDIGRDMARKLSSEPLHIPERGPVDNAPRPSRAGGSEQVEKDLRTESTITPSPRQTRTRPFERQSRMVSPSRSAHSGQRVGDEKRFFFKRSAVKKTVFFLGLLATMSTVILWLNQGAMLKEQYVVAAVVISCVVGLIFGWLFAKSR